MWMLTEGSRSQNRLLLYLGSCSRIYTVAPQGLACKNALADVIGSSSTENATVNFE